MKKAPTKKKKKNGGKKIPFFLVLFFLVCITILISLPIVPTKLFSHAAGNSARDSLQLYWFFPPTYSPPSPTHIPQNNPTPTIVTSLPPVYQPNIPSQSGSFCSADSVKPAGSNCTCPDTSAIVCPASGSSSGTSITCPSGQIAMPLPLSGSNEWYCAQLGTGNEAPPSGCSAACIGKPVIYLYPTHQMTVSVSLKIPGTIVKSDPVYPQNGWQNIQAYPNGSLLYNNTYYHELFYESSVTIPIPMPETGIVIPIKDLSQKLEKITHQLGLIPNEQQEFLNYWMPILDATHSPYIFFSVLPENEKESVDHVDISPRPDTSIAFIAYFKPLSHPITTSPLILPQKPLARHGFTSVEWGGTLENNKQLFNLN
jgi:hypothetical protein